jgi:nucleoside 2-deoxyribosyltransferase
MTRLRVYISGPLQAAEDLAAARRFYERLAELCVEAGAEPYLPHQRTDPELHTDTLPVSVFRRDRLAIRKCDLLIAHIGPPSSGVGAELGLAFSSQQPIIAVYHATECPSRFVLGMLEDYEAAIVISFESGDDLAASVRNALTIFSERSNRGQGGATLRRIA